ncbi:biotin--[acetyl-CoA-carboxylase] ligase [Pseudozobellia thermophila]|uniref:BirA family transcriptional regulator, biotin operon repressor / biotin-[acetyl-CoA-carboxylase] ligase n=1 Tax=Pseudozobellia thermophila TaxID=192903 RepID=A0A1M6JXV3_9FLAO|nr:biotin--[acetyl-CoA-carboxylase] ligase [Pseudozobellia thermophila]SHJ51537.1 BirA family transcriptional regulator, biotin operon repressor / biotin-[acetyl-CoA-carboxylase] ligase [Pseudozobellia thermophila]
MHLIKLDATHSTNDYLKDLMALGGLSDFTTIWAGYQSKGKGQMGAKWTSEKGKNLTFSVLKTDLSLPVAESYTLNVCVALALYNYLKAIRVPNLKIKWPNDILSGTSKVCGILIENQLKGNLISSAILGIGLNVNQTDFHSLQNVTSLNLLFDRAFNLDKVLRQIVHSLQEVFAELESKGGAQLWATYESALFRKDKPSTFEDPSGQLFMGFIRRVSPDGKLVLELEDRVMREFDLKELRLLY